MVFRGGFVVVRGGFSPKISRKRSCDPLFNQSENQIHYEISFLMRLLICSFPFKEHTSKELCLKKVNYFTCMRHFSCRWYRPPEVDLN